MSIKTIKADIAEVLGRLWRNCQYLAHTQKQLALIYRATPATGHRSRVQLRARQAALARDSRKQVYKFVSGTVFCKFVSGTVFFFRESRL